MYVTHDIQYFDTFFMLLKGVPIGLAVQNFDRMCAIWLVCPGCQKDVLSSMGKIIPL